MQRAMLQLQRQHGNHFVRRVVKHSRIKGGEFGEYLNQTQTSISRIQRMCTDCKEEIERKPEIKSTLVPIYKPGLQSSVRGTQMYPAVHDHIEPILRTDLKHGRVHDSFRDKETARPILSRALIHECDNWLGQVLPTNDLRLNSYEKTLTIQQNAQDIQRWKWPWEEEQPLVAKTGLAEATTLTVAKIVFAEIQGHAMSNLLPKLQALPREIRTHEVAGLFVGGPRLVTAMHVVSASGKSWLEFAASHNNEMAALPIDQLTDIMNFLGAPTNARYFKADQFGGLFDGAVDPNGGVVVLYQRVKFEVYSAKFGVAAPGTPDWEEETRIGLTKFKKDYKRVVEEIWSDKGSIRPACPVGSVKALNTKVVVSVVESGEHNLIYIHSDTTLGRSNQGVQHGNLKVPDNLPKTKKSKYLTQPVCNQNRSRLRKSRQRTSSGIVLVSNIPAALVVMISATVLRPRNGRISWGRVINCRSLNAVERLCMTTTYLLNESQNAGVVTSFQAH